MKFNNKLVEGILVKRYKRFLADVILKNGNIITVHTPNTGAMTGCSVPGSRVWIQDSGNSKRKYPYGWELVETSPGVLTGVNTIMANKLIHEAINSGRIVELQNIKSIKPEVSYGKEKSRIDFLIQSENAQDCYVEVKSVTLVKDKIAYFPDAVSKRGSKHLRELINIVREGHRGVIIYCIQRNDAEFLSPADLIDPEYGILLREAISAGVEAIAYKAIVSPLELVITDSVPVICP
ncbi:MAG: sugar fermentation stimulation protein A [Gammaproteobacteria bacterium]|jgi:sugar fermentation stimulation protein A